MTKKEIIEMAQRCGLFGIRPYPDGTYSEALEAFANLIRADYGKLHASLWLKRIDDAVKKERERIKEQNAPEIEKINTYIKQLEDKLKELE